MLALPLQRGSTGDTIKWTSDFMNTTFGPNSASRFDKDLIIFQKVRQSAVAVSEASGEAGLTPLSVAIHHLKSVARRLTEYSSDLKLTFCYQDAFKPTKSISSNSLYYDLSTFLWNFAALQSQIGSRVDRSSDDGIRAANKHFQSAAGALEWICDNCIQYLNDGNSSGPINASVLRMMIMLMLAQAQLCFYEKSVRDRKAGLMKPAIIAKLAAQTSHFYRASADLSKNDYCGTYIDASWSNHADFQYKCFAAAAEYWQSQAVREEALSRGCGYGEEIARLLRATATLKQAIDTATANKLGPSSINGAAALKRTVDAAKAAAERDNNTVYMEQIPVDNTLLPVPPVAMAKPLQLPEYAGFDDSEPVLFKDVQPKAIRTLIATTRDKLDLLLAETRSLTNGAADEGRRRLGSVGLPGSLEADRAVGKAGAVSVLPAGLWGQVVRVQSLGGVAELQNRCSDLDGAAKRAQSTMETISASVDRENRMEENFRGMFPTADHEKASVSQIGCVKLELDRLKEDFDNARKIDQCLLADAQECSSLRHMQLLQSSKEELSALLPKPTAPIIDLFGEDSSPAGGDTAGLESKLFELASEIEGRELSLSRQRKAVETDLQAAIFALPSSSDPNQVQALSEQALSAIVAEAEGALAAIQQSVQLQDGILAEIMVENAAFTAFRLSDPSTVERDRVLKSIEDSTSKVLRLHNQLTSGNTFYSNLQVRLTSLLLRCDDISYIQQLERQERENAQHLQIARSNQEREDQAYAMALSEQMKEETTGAPRKGSAPSTLPSPPPAKPVQPGKAVPSSSSKSPPSKSAVVYGQALPPSFSPASLGGPAGSNPSPATQPFMSGTDRPSPSEEAKIRSLTDMGFARDKAIAALKVSAGVVDNAVQIMLQES